QTLAAYRKVAAENSSLLQDEVRFIRERSADVIVSDITPFAFEAAHAAGVPSVGVTNFTWHDIYAPYVAGFPEYRADLDKIRSQYECATELLALEPGPLPMDYFPKRRVMPPVGRIGRRRRDEINAKYGIAPSKHVALIYFGDFGMNGIDWQGLAKFPEWEFLGICPLPGAPPNFRHIDKADFPYQDLAASANCMICKIGYGSVAECMLHGTPVLYLPRDGFAEFPYLDAAVRAWHGGYPLSTEAFCSLSWKDALSDIVKTGQLEPLRGDGARLCAEAIEAIATRKLPLPQ
nr:hypothetical protein [Chitinispirillaceae bacterium]